MERDSTTLSKESKEQLALAARVIRGLAIDAVQKANSGHPGLPMGCAELGAYLFNYVLRYDPKNVSWPNRDRLVLSAGHGSMWLYGCMHLAGYDLSLDDLKQFRQLHSRTPGHPESILTAGVETTTGPLGQGVAHAVGMALGLKILGARFNSVEDRLFSGKVYCLMGDGCSMEGVSAEASSFAGHLGLDNLVLIYDANRVTLDGPLSESDSEEIELRYRGYGWEVITCDGNDLEALHAAFTAIKNIHGKPILLISHTVIGKGSPNKAGTYHVHGAPLGPEEIIVTKEALGLPQKEFFVPAEVYAFFQANQQRSLEEEKAWYKTFEAWSKSQPEQRALFDFMKEKTVPETLIEELKAIIFPEKVAGRKASSMLLETLGRRLPYLYGGSADLSCSDLTMMKAFPIISAGHFEGRNIKFGVREFAMAGMATGLSQTEMILPFIGTFLTFSDYMRNAIRLSALMMRQVVYQFTHDSVFLGEDGPTHQPIEHCAALRAIPHLHVIRPADAHEVRGAWLAALQYCGPTALLLSRQDLPTLSETDIPYSEGVGRGAYLLLRERGGPPDFTLMATGSEVWLALEVAKALEQHHGKRVRVISMPCWEIFEKQEASYREATVGGELGRRVSIEAGVSLGWHRYIGSNGIAISIEEFGASAPYRDLQKFFGFTVENILAKIL